MPITSSFVLPLSALVLIAGAPALRAADETNHPAGVPRPSYPELALEAKEGGTVVVKVLFDSQGHASNCKVVDSNACDFLQKWTVSFITRRWVSMACAGRSVQVPITYASGAPADSPPKGMGLPNFLSPGEPAAKMDLRVMFDLDGLPSDVKVVQSNASESVNQKPWL